MLPISCYPLAKNQSEKIIVYFLYSKLRFLWLTVFLEGNKGNRQQALCGNAFSRCPSKSKKATGQQKEWKNFILLPLILKRQQEIEKVQQVKTFNISNL